MFLYCSFPALSFSNYSWFKSSLPRHLSTANTLGNVILRDKALLQSPGSTNLFMKHEISSLGFPAGLLQSRVSVSPKSNNSYIQSRD